MTHSIYPKGKLATYSQRNSRKLSHQSTVVDASRHSKTVYNPHMRLVTVTSIATLVVSIAAVVLVLGLYAELEKSKSTDAIGNQPPSSEELCLSAENKLDDTV